MNPEEEDYPPLEDNSTRSVKYAPKNPTGKWICKCGGLKEWQSKTCKKCRLSDKRPPDDPIIYYDEQGRPYRRLPCTQKQYALVSAEKYDLVSAYLWVAVYDKSINDYYAMTEIDGKRVRLHRLLLGDITTSKVDHANHSTLDCRDHNIRAANNSQSTCNQRLRRDNKSGFRGVWFRADRNRWCAMVTKNGKHYYTSHCMTAIEAAQEYNKLALQLHGEFACLNEIPTVQQPTRR